ncbi:MAG: FkbM family methyltransferase [Pseudomonadota bacterium]
MSLDAELTRHGIETVDFLKIDVEGYEMQVLQGASEALAAGRIKVILFEFGAHHGAENETFKDFHDLLSGAGYDVYKAMRGRNFFGYGKVPVYREKHEPKEKYVEMVMASLLPPSPAYHGPPVISRSWAADPDKKRPVKEALYKIKQRVLRR